MSVIYKNRVLEIIDSVMNNREIDSIRNAILAIRDKIIDEPEPELCIDTSFTTVKIALRQRNAFLPETGIDGSSIDGAKYAIFNMSEKIDTGLYGSVSYE